MNVCLISRVSLALLAQYDKQTTKLKARVHAASASPPYDVINMGLCSPFSILCSGRCLLPPSV